MALYKLYYLLTYLLYGVRQGAHSQLRNAESRLQCRVQTLLVSAILVFVQVNTFPSAFPSVTLVDGVISTFIYKQNEVSP